jgi:uncharacterized protein (AIM24 family)
MAELKNDPDLSSTSWTIHGEDQQVLHVPLTDGSYVKCEVGCMLYSHQDAFMKVAIMGSGGITGAVGGVVGGESLVCQEWKQKEGTKGYVGITNNLPGKLIPIGHDQMAKGFCCKRGAWVANIGNVSVMPTILSNASCGAVCCGGMALIVQTLSTSDPDAWAFIQGCGTVLTRQLEAGEVMLCDGDSLLAFENSVSKEVQVVGSCTTVCCGGEGCFNTKVTGPGKVYMQSMPIEKLRRLFVQRKGGKKKNKGKNGGS